MQKSPSRTRIRVNGMVQGVGFRPFVYRLAKEFGLKGYVLNDGAGVLIEVEGFDVSGFLQELYARAPARSKIEKIETEALPALDFKNFAILESFEENSAPALISPDIATCDDCITELLNPFDRRYLYPFINCTNCGPRYSIIKKIPYDRPTTTMADFAMCAECRREYDDPLDRRFHAQPNACAGCGPKAWLINSKDANFKIEGRAAIEQTRALIKDGAIVAIKGLGGFHMACDASNDAAVRKLRETKRGSQKPFAIMSPDLEGVKQFASVTTGEARFLIDHTRPITLLRKSGDEILSRFVAPQTRSFGVFLPYTPLHHLISRGFSALVMTSANFSEEPMVISNEEAFTKLNSIVDYFLMHDRDIYMRVDDSIIRRTGKGKRIFLRRGRGYAPEAVDLGKDFENTPKVLAVGAFLKNTFCVTTGRHAILSQHIGDLENESAARFFSETLDNLKRTFRVEPSVVAMDLHPDYQSTRMAEKYADENDIPAERRIRVQHHHAHVASVMAEHSLRGAVIGVAFDGAGFGLDSTIWGGEILTATLSGFKREAHLKAVPLPGGDAASREPWRMAVSYLYEAYGKDFLDALPLNIFESIDRKKISAIVRIMDQKINSPLTSSAGRFFDAVSAILGLRDIATYEGEAAVMLETSAWSFTEKNNSTVLPLYDFKLLDNGDTAPMVIDCTPVIRGIVDDMRAGRETGYMAHRFHFTLAAAISAAVGRCRERTGLNVAVLSGGVFQNALLLDETIKILERDGFTVYHNEKVPANDGGISLGQAAVATTLLTS